MSELQDDERQPKKILTEPDSAIYAYMASLATFRNMRVDL